MRHSFIHVVQHGPGWATRREGTHRVSSAHRTQHAAINVATRVARREHGEVLIHGRDGQIRGRNSYGNDPCPPRG